MVKKLNPVEAVDALDAALAKKAYKTVSKAAPTKRNRARVNDAEPAHSIITLLGGVRELGRCLDISAAAVTRWQTHHTKTDRHGANGVIPEPQRDAILQVAKDKRKRLSRAAFDKV